MGKNSMNAFYLCLLIVMVADFVVAVDFNQDILTNLTAVMKNKADARNIMVKADWSEIGAIFKANSFDLVLGDNSLVNIPHDKQIQVIKDLSSLLKPSGYLIARNPVFLPKKSRQSLEQIQKNYSNFHLDWRWLIVEIGFYSKLKNKIFDSKSKIMSWAKGFDVLFARLNKKEFRVRSADCNNLKNLRQHASQCLWFLFSDKDWQNLIGKFFIIKDRVAVKNLYWTDYAPMWVLRKKS